MPETTIIDNVFIGGHIQGRKHTTRQILGLENHTVRKGHQRFYSKSFIPFAYERDVNGKLIKPQTQNQNTTTQKQTINLRGNNGFLINGKGSKADLSIGCKFHLNEVNHFRSVRITSHVDKLPIFRKELQKLENRASQRIQLLGSKEYEVIQQYSPKEDIIEQNPIKSNTIIKNSSRTNSLQKLTSHTNFVPLLHHKAQQKSFINKLITQRSNSLKTLFKTNPNPIQQIQRQVKVHYNHPELERLKQSRNLTFKFLENIDKGDKIFKQKVQEYRSIKQRIKKQMNNV